MILLAAASAIALETVAAPATAQSMNMPGMTMPMPPKKSPAKKSARKPTPKPVAPAKKATKKSATSPTADEPTSRDMKMPMSAPAQAGPGEQAIAPMDHSQMQHGAMPSQASPDNQMTMPMGEGRPAEAMQHGEHAMHGKAMMGALGPYESQRESSGTAWQPDSTAAMSGPMATAGSWMLMAHGTLNLVYDHQSGPRGDDKVFASGMLMGMARRPLGNGALQLRAMLSPDPLMGAAGYPLLLATGETANGKAPLTDRQHPHDLFMELSTSVSQNIGAKSSLFLYAGLPGEPAFGPPPFMHRESILDSPEAPITHHWLDSTHITFGVVSAGIVVDRLKIEVSRFNAREPDQHRWNIETGPLDSTSVRLSWNPLRVLALQGSWGEFKDPEQLEPGVDQKRWSASALWADDIAPDWHAAATLAWGRKSSEGHHDDAIALEGSFKHAGWTWFGRGERIENRELLGLGEGPAYRVGKISLGAVRDFRIADHWSLGAGGLVSLNWVPDALAPLYGGTSAAGAMGFLRVKLD